MTELEYLSGGDTLFLDIESDVTPMYVCACLIFEAGPLTSNGVDIDFKRIRDFIESRLDTHIRYRQRTSTTPIEGRPIWVDVARFDIREHVRYEKLPAGAEESVLRAHCARFAAEPIDPARPLWEISVIDGFAAGRVALAIKAHHCLADGVAGIQLLRSLLSLEPGEAFTRSTARFGSTRAMRRLALIRAELRDRAHAARDLVQHAARVLEQRGAFVDSAIDGAIGFLHVLQNQRRPASPSLLDTTNGPTRSLDWMSSDLSRLSEIRLRRGGTLNDIVVATVALALGRHFEAQGISREEQRRMEFRVAVPINMRADSDHPEIGNRISMIFAKIPLGESSALSVFDQTRDSLLSAKQSHSAEALGSILSLADWTPRALTRRLTRWAIESHPANLVVTNIPGPDRPLYLLKSRLQAAYPVVPLMPRQSFGIAVLSYDGKLYWGFHSDEAHFPTPVAWAKEVGSAFEELYSAAMRS